SGDEERRKKWKPLDVIPVRMRDHQMAVAARLLRGHQRVPESVSAGPAVEDHEGAIDASNLHARGVAAIAQRGGTRLGHGTTGTPEPDVHSVPLWSSRAASSRHEAVGRAGQAPAWPSTDRSTAECMPQRT